MVSLFHLVNVNQFTPLHEPVMMVLYRANLLCICCTIVVIQVGVRVLSLSLCVYVTLFQPIVVLPASLPLLPQSQPRHLDAEPGPTHHCSMIAVHAFDLQSDTHDQ
jgi:hypothetical protein